MILALHDDAMAPADPAAEDEPRLQTELSAMSEVPLEVTVRLGSARMTLGELLDLRQGSVLLLDREVGEPAEILVGDRVVALGEMVRVDQDLGVRLTRVSGMGQ